MFATDLFLGLWKLNPATLDYQFGRPGRRAMYLIERSGQQWRFTLDGDDADGKSMCFSYSGLLDGEDYPCMDQSVIDSLQLSLVDEATIESVAKKDGKVVDRWRRVVSPDGRILTITQYGSNPENEHLRNVSVYEKQYF